MYNMLLDIVLCGISNKIFATWNDLLQSSIDGNDWGKHNNRIQKLFYITENLWMLIVDCSIWKDVYQEEGFWILYIYFFTFWSNNLKSYLLQKWIKLLLLGCLESFHGIHGITPFWYLDMIKIWCCKIIYRLECINVTNSVPWVTISNRGTNKIYQDLNGEIK